MADSNDGLDPNLSDPRKRVTRGLAWMTGQTGVNFVVQIVTVVVVSRLLSPTEVGVVAASMGIIAVCTMLVHLGLGEALVQRDNVGPLHVATALTVVLGLGALAITTVWLLAPALSSLIDIPAAASVLQALSWVILFQALTIIAQSLARRRMNLEQVALANGLGQLFGTCGVTITCAFAGFGLWSLVAGHLATSVIRLSAIALLVRYRWRVGFSLPALRELFSFAGFFSLERLAARLANRIDRPLIGAMLGAESVGLYARAQKLLEVATQTIFQPLGYALFPVMSRVQKERRKLIRAHHSVATLSGLIAVPGSLILVFASPALVPLLLGPQWGGVVEPLQILAISIAVRPYLTAAALLAKSVGRMRERAIAQIAFACGVLLSIAGLHPWGLAGIAVGILVAMLLRAAFMIWLSARILDLPIPRLLASLVPGILVTVPIAVLLGAFQFLWEDWLFETSGMLVFIAVSVSYVGLVVLQGPDFLLTKDLIKVRAELFGKLRRRLTT